MKYYIIVEKGIITNNSPIPCTTEGAINVEVPEELYNAVDKNREKYIYSNGEIILNPNYEQEQAAKRREQFNKDFFNTSLGYIRRNVTMKTGMTKDFLTDLLPVITIAVNNGKSVNIITYKEPDFTQEITDWESLQEIKQATPQFIQECLNQVSIDFTGVQQ